MKRSDIDNAIDWAIECCKRKGVYLPEFAFWSSERWKEEDVKGTTKYMHKVKMGWDVTDYESGDFDHTGGVLFTVRNGEFFKPERGRVYCEKFLMMKAGQMLPCHFHWYKTEDIINRSGGTLRVYLWNSTPEFDGWQKDLKGDVHVLIDSRPVTVAAGGYVDIKPGDSIYITPYMYHAFSAVETDGDLIVGEVSRCNDDANDNNFNPYVNFSKIIEDVPARHILCGGYEQ